MPEESRVGATVRHQLWGLPSLPAGTVALEKAKEPVESTPRIAAPHERRPMWHQAPLVVGPLVLLTVVTWVGTLATPALVGASPLILMLLSPRTPVMVLAAATNPMWLFVAVGTFRLAIADPFNFMIGRLWGHQAMIWSSERSKVARWVLGATERAMGRAGLLVVAVHPAGSVMILAGATGMSWIAVAAADLVGTALYLVLMKLAAPWMAGPFQQISKLLGHYCVIASLAVAAGVGVWTLLVWRSHRRLRPPSPAMDAELAEMLTEAQAVGPAAVQAPVAA
jgi:hypothetical protein